ncbi:MAG: hypothetical protein NZM37_12530 [Sandaracinaceae bacterium]|nr:hypothetical protein [Sandaracinaceae bacterium]
MKQLARLDFGRSWRDGQPVSETLPARLPRTLLLITGLVFCAFLWSVFGHNLCSPSQLSRGLLGLASSYAGASTPSMVAG